MHDHGCVCVTNPDHTMHRPCWDLHVWQQNECVASNQPYWNDMITILMLWWIIPLSRAEQSAIERWCSTSGTCVLLRVHNHNYYVEQTSMACTMVLIWPLAPKKKLKVARMKVSEVNRNLHLHVIVLFRIMCIICLLLWHCTQSKFIISNTICICE